MDVFHDPKEVELWVYKNWGRGQARSRSEREEGLESLYG